jgi:hypothetical protein
MTTNYLVFDTLDFFCCCVVCVISLAQGLVCSLPQCCNLISSPESQPGLSTLPHWTCVCVSIKADCFASLSSEQEKKLEKNKKNFVHHQCVCVPV